MASDGSLEVRPPTADWDVAALYLACYESSLLKLEKGFRVEPSFGSGEGEGAAPQFGTNWTRLAGETPLERGSCCRKVPAYHVHAKRALNDAADSMHHAGGLVCPGRSVLEGLL